MELLVLLGLVAVGVTLSSLVDFSSDEDADPITRTDGTEGDDTIIGGEGRDLLIGAAGADSLDGGAGDDQLEGGFGDDLLQGGAGDDALLAARGEDTLLGGDGSDFLYGGVGDDSLSGDAGEDLLDGGQGEDTLIGGAGNDILFGIHDSVRDGVIDAADLLDVDRMEGGAGQDIFFMGTGDVANGGVDGDAFLTGAYVDGTQPPVVEDFTPGEDRLVIQVPEGATGTVGISSDSGAAVVTVNGQAVARLEGVAGLVTILDIAVLETSALRAAVS